MVLPGHVMDWYAAWDMGRAEPGAKVMPTPLVDSSVADLSAGTTLTSFGYSMRVPWTRVEHRLDMKGASSFEFGGGAKLLLFDPAQHMNVQRMYTSGTPRQNAVMAKMMRSRELSSNYELFNAAVESSPAQASLWKSNTANMRVLTLTMLKGIFVMGDVSAIHPVEGKQVRGFEALEMLHSASVVHLMLFDAKDRQIEMMFSWPKGDTQDSLSQPQINGIVASIEPQR